MRFKLDENLTPRLRKLFVAAGHDVSTIYEQEMTSSNDFSVARICKDEERCLVTLDLDFSNPLIFSPHRYHGIAVIRIGKRTSFEDLSSCCSNLILAVAEESIIGKLWIIELNRIRKHQGP